MPVVFNMHLNFLDTSVKSSHAAQYSPLCLVSMEGPAIVISFLNQRRSSEIRRSVVQRFEEMHAVLDEDLRITLGHLETEEKAAAAALETLMERNGSLIQEIEQDLSTLGEALDQTVTETNIRVTTNRPKRKTAEKNNFAAYMSF